MDEFRARPKEASAADLDQKVSAALREDARAQLSAMAASIAESCRAQGPGCKSQIGIDFPHKFVV